MAKMNIKTSYLHKDSSKDFLKIFLPLVNISPTEKYLLSIVSYNLLHELKGMYRYRSKQAAGWKGGQTGCRGLVLS